MPRLCYSSGLHFCLNRLTRHLSINLQRDPQILILPQNVEKSNLLHFQMLPISHEVPRVIGYFLFYAKFSDLDGSLWFARGEKGESRARVGFSLLFMAFASKGKAMHSFAEHCWATAIFIRAPPLLLVFLPPCQLYLRRPLEQSSTTLYEHVPAHTHSSGALRIPCAEDHITVAVFSLSSGLAPLPRRRTTALFLRRILDVEKRVQRRCLTLFWIHETLPSFFMTVDTCAFY